MGRPAGRRNEDYEVARTALLEKLAKDVGADDARLSFRELALKAGVSPATLRHYFGTREGLWSAVMVWQRKQASQWLGLAASMPMEGVRDSLSWLLHTTAGAWTTFGVGGVHGLGIAAGLGDPALGPAYINEVLEPTLQAAEARIARHVAQGELGTCDLRHAALELLSPVLMGLLHQDSLFGARCRPLDLTAFIEDHLTRFLRGHAPSKR